MLLLVIDCEELFVHLEIVLIGRVVSRVMVMRWILNGRATMIKLLHELLLKLIVIFNSIMKLLMIIRIKILIFIFIEWMIIILHFKLMLRPWGSAIAYW